MLPRTVRLSYWLRSTSDSDEANPWIVTSWHEVGAGIDTAQLLNDTVGPTPTLSWSVWWNAISAGPAGTGGLRAALPLNVNWYRLEMAANMGSSIGDATVTGEYDVAANIAGARSGAVAPQPMCVIARKIPLAGTKKHRGRNYLPALAGDFAYDGQVTSGTRTTIAAAYTPLLTNPYIMADYQMITPGSDGISRYVGSFDCAPMAGVQRRRLR